MTAKRQVPVWAMAIRLPTAIDSTDKITSICCQSPCKAPSPSTSTRITSANAASLGAEPIYNVTEVGAP